MAGSRLLGALGMSLAIALLPQAPSPAQSGGTSLAGVWAAQRIYAHASLGHRGAFDIRAGGGSFTHRFATPLRSGPIHDVQHIFLIIAPAADGTLSARFRNPEFNIGAEIGPRSVTVSGETLVLRRPNRPDLKGMIAGQTLRFHFDDFPSEFVFSRANARNTGGLNARAGGAAYLYHVPKNDGDGWKTASLRAANLDPDPIFDLMNQIIKPDATNARAYIQSVLIARHGRLVLDEYFYGFDRERPHDVRSAGKSVTTLLVGRAREDGSPVGPAAKLPDVFQNYMPFAHNDARKERITIGNLMAMNSGLACDDNDDASPGNEGTMQSQTAQPDWYKYTLDLPMAYAPGTHGSYCTAGINLLGGVLARGTRTWLPEYFDRQFARPMQFKQYAMWLMPPPLSDAYMGGGDYFRPRDFLKFGELFLRHGTWNGRRIIADRWLREIATRHTTIEGEIGDYGYGWHILTYSYRGRTIHAVNAGGNGGQLLFVFPQLDMAVMITAGNYGEYPVWSKFITRLVPRYILPAVIGAPTTRR